MPQKHHDQCPISQHTNNENNPEYQRHKIRFEPKLIVLIWSFGCCMIFEKVLFCPIADIRFGAIHFEFVFISNGIYGSQQQNTLHFWFILVSQVYNPMISMMLCRNFSVFFNFLQSHRRHAYRIDYFIWSKHFKNINFESCTSIFSSWILSFKRSNSPEMCIQLWLLSLITYVWPSVTGRWVVQFLSVIGHDKKSTQNCYWLLLETKHNCSGTFSLWVAWLQTMKNRETNLFLMWQLYHPKKPNKIKVCHIGSVCNNIL